MTSFKPKGQTRNNNFPPRDPNFKFPEPQAGNQLARISLIVDLGTQEREDFVGKDGVAKPQTPCQQVAVFADLVDSRVDYGSNIGEKAFRLILNKSFKGEVTGINFAPVPPRDADGNLIENKEWTFHPQNLLTRLATATGEKSIVGGENNMDISLLLGKPLMIDVEVKKTPSGRKGEDGEEIIWTNINQKAYATVPSFGGKVMDVPELDQPAMLITFDNVTPESAVFLRADIKRKLKMAQEYPGSVMQQVLEGMEGVPSAEPVTKASTNKESDYNDFDDQIPF